MEPTDTEKRSEALEQRLARLQPAPVSAELMARLLAARPRSGGGGRRARRLWIVLAAAAALAVCVSVLRDSGTPGVHPECAEPAAEGGVPDDLTADTQRERLLGARDAGRWRAPDGRIYKVIHCLSVDQSLWRNSASEVKLELLRPKQRVLLLAMGTQ
jgi:hypothetical protein